MSEHDEMTIDLERIVRQRAGKSVPGFVIRWLKRVIHEDFINEFLRRGHVGVDFCTKGVEYLGVTLTIEGLDQLPQEGRFTFVSNHPLGGIDGVALGGIIGTKYDGHVKYLVNDLLLNLKGLAPLCVGINKFGGQSRSLSQQVDSVFHGDDQVIMFPAGICSRKINGQIRDLQWGKAFIQKSVQTQRDVVPIHFIAENSPRFYRIANWCKRLGLKVNLAMLLLPDEMYRSCGSHYTVRFGHPIPYTTFDHTRRPAEWAEWVKEKVYEL